MYGFVGNAGSSAIPMRPRLPESLTCVTRSAKTTGEVSFTPAKTLMSPLFSATKIRPSDANYVTVGLTSPASATDSENPTAPVENDQTTGAGIWLPARSFTPLMVAVNVCEMARLLVGMSVAVCVDASYDTVAGTSALLESRKENVIEF